MECREPKIIAKVSPQQLRDKYYGNCFTCNENVRLEDLQNFIVKELEVEVCKECEKELSDQLVKSLIGLRNSKLIGRGTTHDR